MKKFLTVLLVVILAISFVACGAKKESIEGTWEVDYIEYEGSQFTVDEWKTTEDEDYSNFFIIFKKGGKGYIFDGEYDYLVDWIKTEDGVVLDGEHIIFVDGKLCLDDGYETKIYLKKSSDSEEITKNTAKPTATVKPTATAQANATTSATAQPTTNATENSDWRQFLKDYEAWVDKYIDIYKRYQENPTDMNLLNEYMELLTEMTEWSERADEIEIEDAQEALEYSKELSRIISKLSEAY